METGYRHALNRPKQLIMPSSKSEILCSACGNAAFNRTVENAFFDPRKISQNTIFDQHIQLRFSNLLLQPHARAPLRQPYLLADCAKHARSTGKVLAFERREEESIDG
ncbi:hypothetical protein D3C76_750570 [compost metagenome]